MNITRPAQVVPPKFLGTSFNSCPIAVQRHPSQGGVKSTTSKARVAFNPNQKCQPSCVGCSPAQGWNRQEERNLSLQQPISVPAGPLTTGILTTRGAYPQPLPPAKHKEFLSATIHFEELKITAAFDHAIPAPRHTSCPKQTARAQL